MASFFDKKKSPFHNGNTQNYNFIPYLEGFKHMGFNRGQTILNDFDDYMNVTSQCSRGKYQRQADWSILCNK